MKNLLLITHCPSVNTIAMRDAVIKGVNHPDIDDIEFRSLDPISATADDVMWADAIIIGTTENFGYMAGRIKDFFERIYYPCLEQKQGLPYALYIRAGNDGSGTQSSIERIITGLKWREVNQVMICCGGFEKGFLRECEELGMKMAAGLSAAIF